MVKGARKQRLRWRKMKKISAEKGPREREDRPAEDACAQHANTSSQAWCTISVPSHAHAFYRAHAAYIRARTTRRACPLVRVRLGDWRRQPTTAAVPVCAAPLVW